MGSRRFVLFGRWREPESPAHALAERVSAVLRGDPTPEERERVEHIFREVCGAHVMKVENGANASTYVRNVSTERLTKWEVSELYRRLPQGTTIWIGGTHVLWVTLTWGDVMRPFGTIKVPREGDAPGTGATDMPGAS